MSIELVESHSEWKGDTKIIYHKRIRKPKIGDRVLDEGSLGTIVELGFSGDYPFVEIDLDEERDNSSYSRRNICNFGSTWKYVEAQ